jgi:hypothetical protein
MRFNANQLRLLQECLAPPVPCMAAPPEMQQAAAAAPAKQHEASFWPSQQRAQAPDGSRVPCWLLAPCYALSAALAAGLALSLPAQLPASAGAAATALLPAALVVHALCTPQSRAAQGLAAACAAAVPAACCSGEPYAGLAAAVLLSAFFCSALVSGQCPGVLKLLVPAFTLLVGSCGAIGIAAQDAPQLRRCAWALACAALCAQAVAASLRLRTFELVCAVRAL